MIDGRSRFRPASYQCFCLAGMSHAVITTGFLWRFTANQS